MKKNLIVFVFYKSTKHKTVDNYKIDGADGGSRTHTLLRAKDFKSPVYAISPHRLIWSPQPDSNQHSDFRRVMSYPLDDEGFSNSFLIYI